MAALSLQLLGPFTATLNDQPLQKFRTSKVQALLTYLAVEDLRPHRRELLFTLLWPGMPEKSARHNLSQTLYALRQLIPSLPSKDGPETVPLIFSNRHTVHINPEADFETDTRQVDELIKATQDHPHNTLEECTFCRQCLEELVNTYRGEFLTDFYLEDSSTFEEWAAVVRESYQRKLIDGLTILSDIAIYQQNFDMAIHYIDRRLVLEDLNERAHRQKIEVLALSGRRMEAMGHYRAFEQQMEIQLGTGPSQETIALYERVRAEDYAPLYPQTGAAISRRAAVQHNLPPQPTPFIGRQLELTRLDGLLRDPSNRLITITGPGGMGKTRLAIACAGRQLAVSETESEQTRYPDGIYFVSLEDFDSPDQITKQIATTLNLERPAQEFIGRKEGLVNTDQMLREYLSHKQLLLILDNFEQFAGEGRILADLLISAPTVQLLVTSRERLNLHGEQAFRIEGLIYPDEINDIDPDEFSAIQLFEERARRLQPDFVLNTEDFEHLARICRLVDGMPLGLELAASWVDLIPIKEIAAEIHKSLDFLESDTADMPTRHHSLRGVFSTTWRYLDAAERRVFMKLSVFRGGFRRAAAQEVAGAHLRALSNLTKKSILRYDPELERYRIHPVLRQFGVEQLTQNPDLEYKVRDAHSAYFSARLENCDQILKSGQPHLAFENIETDLKNIMVSWEWAVSQLNLERIQQSMDILCRYFQWYGRNQEGLRFCQALDRRLVDFRTNTTTQNQVEINDFLLDRLYARVLIWEADFNLIFDPDQAENLLTLSMVELARLDQSGADIRDEKALWLFCQAEKTSSSMRVADLQRSNKYLQESISLLENTTNVWGLMVCYLEMAHYYEAMDDHQNALESLERGVSIAKKQGSRHYEVLILIRMGRVRRRQADYEAARTFFQKALSKAEAYQMPVETRTARQFLNDLSLFLGNINESIIGSQQSLALAKEKYSIQNVDSLTNLGVSQWLAGDFENAQATFEMAVDITQQLSSMRVVFSNLCLAELLALTGRYDQAALRIGQVNDWTDAFNMDTWPHHFSRTARIQGWLALVRGDAAGALDNFESGIRGAPNDLESVAWTQPYLALAHFRMGDRNQARKLLNQALTTAVEIQGYIPMMFALPVSPLIFMDENFDFSCDIYTQLYRDPLLNKARLFHDLVYKHLPEKMTSQPVETVRQSSENRKALWDTARLVLAHSKIEK